MNTMNATHKLHGLGQSLWLDNITRDMLNSGTLSCCINEFYGTGLTSDPIIFDPAIKNSGDYDAAICQKLKEGKSGEELFFEQAWTKLRLLPCEWNSHMKTKDAVKDACLSAGTRNRPLGQCS
jgi:transaldolase